MKEVYQQNAKIILREEGTEAMLFNPDTADIMVVNPTGRIVWLLCDGRHTIGDIASGLEREFNVSLEQAQKDVSKFIVTLLQKGFLLRS